MYLRNIMTRATSSNTRDMTSLKIRCGFFGIEYKKNTCGKISESTKTKSTRIKMNRKNIGFENTKKLNRKIEKNNIKVQNRKLNQKNTNNSRKMNNLRNGLNIIEQIVRIGSALSGLLPMRLRLIRQTVLYT